MPRGLPNIAASCYINGALQLIALNARLRARVLDPLARDHPVALFFGAYDDAADDAALERHHAEATRAVRALRPKAFAAGHTGMGAEVLTALNVPSTEVIGEINVLHRELAAGAREFQIGSDANVNNLRFAPLHAAGDLGGFLHFTGDHYVAFARHGAQWYRLDDRRVTAVEPADLEALPARVRLDAQGYPVARDLQGIVFATYVDPLP